jgi:hypothetical protein
MNAANSSENIDHNRRRFPGSAPMTIASAQLGFFSSANADTTHNPKPPKRREP